MSLHVVFLTAHYPPQIGGIETLLDRLGRGLVAKWGFAVTAVTRSLDEAVSVQAMAGTRVWRLPTVGKRKWLKLAIDLLRILRQDPADVLICVEPRLRLALPAILATQAVRIPMVLLLTGTYSEQSRWISRWIAGAGARRIIGISRYTLSRYQCWPSRTEVVPIGVEPPEAREEQRAAEGRETVLTVARVNPRKNLEQVIRVAQLLPQYRFVIVGDTTARPDYYVRLLELKDAAGVENVVFTGEIPEAAKLEQYRRARLFFLPTHHEMFGIVFVEAMAHGLPVVATKTAAVPEVVTPEVGRLLPTASSPRAFADAIEGLIRDDATWQQMSANGKARAARFAWEDTLDAYARICAEVANNEPVRAG